MLLVAAAALGFYRLGSPDSQRRLAEDRRRVRDLIGICAALKDIHDRAPAAPIPASLSEVKTASLRVIAIADPVTGAPYRYERTSDRTYRLCAVFHAAADADPEAAMGEGPLWRHAAGEHCYELNANKGPWELTPGVIR
ncbi:MAG TPA: hypothetical protein DEH78_05385 [Solibacterales bacterium]|nr:hypothetical protein [Bryobacterales bacterium]